ncbi:hypothetical protein [Fredinandcohnia quinoae]|uniref:Uncharacterized protein n=1 Tax=Fredinandcohnia quinoae TaxID=2918902 RepID=A0AAW5E893_9BACI|nr:hypothetical protein [Fredinandcohnia sp. SECRCQ15]MCH1626241.1 hypothetical protein [Fredinandcohnia sp. SECRCQ15]
MKKLLSTLALASALTFATSFYEVNAMEITPFGAGEWDVVNVDESVYISSTFQRPGGYVTESNGGDFAVDLSFPTQFPYPGLIYVELWEDDGSKTQRVYPDKGTHTVEVSGNGGLAVWRGISSYLDGKENQAEFFIKIKGNGGQGLTYVEYLD